MESLERFAEIRAEIERTGDLEASLRRSGVAPAAWHALEHHWQGALAREIAAGGRELMDRYRHAFLGGAAAATTGLLPSYLAEQRDQAPAIRFVAPVQAAPKPPPKVTLPASALSDAANAGSVVPFRAADPRDVERRKVVPLPIAPVTTDQSGFTQAPLHDPTDGTFPFAAEDKQQGADMSLERYAEITTMLTREGNPDATFRRLGISAADWMKVVRSFSARFASDPALLERFQARMETASSDAKAPRMTVALPTEADELDGDSTNLLGGPPKLTLEQYAWLVASMRGAAGSNERAALARFELTPTSRKYLDVWWQARLDANPAERARFEQLVASYFTSRRR